MLSHLWTSQGAGRGIMTVSFILWSVLNWYTVRRPPGETHSETKWKVEREKREHSTWDEKQLQQFAQYIWLLNLKMITGGGNGNEWNKWWLILTQIEVFRFYTWIWPLPSSADSFWAPNPNIQSEKTRKGQREWREIGQKPVHTPALPAPDWASAM